MAWKGQFDVAYILPVGPLSRDVEFAIGVAAFDKIKMGRCTRMRHSTSAHWSTRRLQYMLYGGVGRVSVAWANCTDEEVRGAELFGLSYATPPRTYYVNLSLYFD